MDTASVGSASEEGSVSTRLSTLGPIQAPPTCPFSGVAVDPAMWAAFRASLASGSSGNDNHHHHHHRDFHPPPPPPNQRSTSVGSLPADNGMDDSSKTLITSPTAGTTATGTTRRRRNTFTAMDEPGMEALRTLRYSFPDQNEEDRARRRQRLKVQAQELLSKAGNFLHQAEQRNKKAKLKAGINSNNNSNHSINSSSPVPVVLEESSAPSAPLISNTTTTRKKNMLRVQVMNQTTKRHKDLVLNRNQKEVEEDLFTAIYNNTTVKQANVRKWGAKIAQDVKKGVSEIKIRIRIGDDDNDNNDKIVTVEKLKQMTIEQLFEMVEAGTSEQVDEVVHFFLMCVPKDDEIKPTAAAAEQEQSPGHSAALALAPVARQDNVKSVQEEKSKTEEVNPRETANTPQETATPPPVAAEKPKDSICVKVKNHPSTKSSSQSIRVRVSNQSSKRQKDLILDHPAAGHAETLFSAIYNNDSVKAANIRKWGGKISQDVKKGLAEIKVQIQIGDNVKDARVLTVDDLRQTSTQQLFQWIAAAEEGTQQQQEPDIAYFTLMSVPVADDSGKSINNIPGEEEKADKATRNVEEAAPRDSGKVQGDAAGSPVPADPTKHNTSICVKVKNQLTKPNNSIRVRVSNQMTNRQKDLILNRSNEDDLYTAIYDNPSVKEANVRKWGGKVAQEVKKGVAEIMVKIQVGVSTGGNVKVFTIEGLRQSTLQQLFDMVESGMSESMDSVVQFCLMCVPKDEGQSTSLPEETLATTPKAEQSTASMNGSSPTETAEVPPAAQVKSATSMCVRVKNPIVKSRSSIRVRVMNQSTKRHKDLILSRSDSQDSLFAAIYDNPTVKGAHIRKWGPQFTQDVKSGSAQIKVQVTVGEIDRILSLDELKQTTTQQLFEWTLGATSGQGEPVVQCCLMCVPKGEEGSAGASQKAELATSQKEGSEVTMSNAEGPAMGKDPAAEVKSSKSMCIRVKNHAVKSSHSLRVQVMNLTKKRRKDIILNQADPPDSLFAAIYDNPTVKSAHLRKWGAQITQDVKQGLAEIKVHMMIGGMDRMLSIPELKQTSTQQLFEWVMNASRDQSESVVRFRLMCVHKREAISPGTTQKTAAEAQTGGEQPTAREDNVASVSLPAVTSTVSLAGAVVAKPSDSIRVRVSNQVTKRYKDLILNRTEEGTLFTAIYNNSAVKEANVRKWGSPYTQNVKGGTAEIKIDMQLGDQKSKDQKILSIDEIKQITTQELFEMVAAGVPAETDAIVQFRLICVPKSHDKATEKATSPVASAAKVDPTTSLPTKIVSSVKTKAEPQSKAPPPKTLQVQFPVSDSISLVKNKLGSNVAIQSAPEASQQSAVGSTGCGSNDESSAASSNQAQPTRAIAKAPIVRTTSSCSALSSSSMQANPAENVPSNECHDEKPPGGAAIAREPALRITSSKSDATSSSMQMQHTKKRPSAASAANGSQHAQDEVIQRLNAISIGASSHSYFDSTLSEGLGHTSLSMMDYDHQSQVSVANQGDETAQKQQPQHPLAPINKNDKIKSTLGVRIINQVTSRSKDLVVAINDTDTIFDAVYNHEAVKAAHVRKWGGPVAKAVKHGAAEIKFSVWDDDTGKPWRVFAIEELKTTTTRQLYELVSESSNLVKIYLQCTQVNGSNENGVSNIGGNSSGSNIDGNGSMATPQSSTHSRRLLPKVRPTPMRQASLRLEKHGRPQFSITESVESLPRAESSAGNPASIKKKPSRSNHMKLSSFMGRHDSCPTDMSNLMNRRAILRGSHESLTAATQQRFKMQELTSSRSVDLDERLQQQKAKSAMAASSSADNLQNATWEVRKTPRKGRAPNSKVRMNRATSLDASPLPTQQLEIMPMPPALKRLQSDTAAENNNNPSEGDQKREKLKQFLRLLRTKKGPEFQSQRDLLDKSAQEEETPAKSAEKDNKQDAVPMVVQTTDKPGNLSKRVSSLSFHDKRPSFTVGAPNAVFTPTVRRSEDKDKISRFLRLDTSIQSASTRLSGNSSSNVDKTSETRRNDNMDKSQGTNDRTSSTKTNDKISRFLALQNEGITPSQQGTGKDSVGGSRASRKSGRKRLTRRPSAVGQVDIPPIAEISLVPKDDDTAAPPASVRTPGVSLSSDLVKEIFPYHVVLDSDFRVTQVGSSFEMLIQESSVVGRIVHDLMTVTSPMPMLGKWNWSVLEKMKDKTIFLETILSPAMEEQVRLKGTLVEISKSPKQVMLVLFPNVKNLAELEEANLSMADLPLHSCQREAVLLGEHSKSEVKLTNHLDKLHRDLIDSMEQQIKDRTEELAEANRDLETANAQLAIQSARQLEHFACMSHEIRTPLNCIVGMSSLLLDDAEEMDPMHSDSIRMINTSGDLLKAVVDDVLDYAKLESGSFEVDIKNINLQHTLSSVVHSISQKVQDKNVRLRLHYSPLLPEIFETDSRRLQQVLFNLLGNSGKFSKKNSVIDFTVSVIPVGSTDVDPENTSTGEVVRFSVKDYGKGIEKKDFKTIFDPFSQASKETQTLYGGTGLGLSITSKLVKRLGGTIAVQSEYGKFAEFTVDLPFKGKQVNVPKLRKRLRNTSIVVVEPKQQYDYSFTTYKIKEEPVSLRAAESCDFGINVIRCENLEEAYKKLRKANLVTPDQHFALLVHEDLYQFGTIERLEEILCRLNYTLMTFGPTYGVEMTKDRHFKSLDGVFPSALLSSIAEHIERRKHEKMFSNRRLSILKSPQSSTPQSARNLFHGITEAKNGKLFAPFTESRRHSAPSIAVLSKGLVSKSPGTGATSDDLSRRLGGSRGANAGSGPERKLQNTPGGLFATANSVQTSGQRGLFANTGTNGSGQQPQASAPPAALTPPPPDTGHWSSPSQSLKVLYAEDNLINQKVLSRVLKRVGVTDITLVDNGKKAVDVCETEKFDCIFMDAQMPIMGGLEATKLIVERDPKAKVVFVTAHAEDEFKAKADAVGASGFLSKPFRLDDMKKLLDELRSDSEVGTVADTGSSPPPQGGLFAGANGNVASTTLSNAVSDKSASGNLSSKPASGGLFDIHGTNTPDQPRQESASSTATPLFAIVNNSGSPAATSNQPPQPGLFAIATSSGPSTNTANNAPVQQQQAKSGNNSGNPPPQGGLFAGLSSNAPPKGGLFAGLSSNPPPQGGLFAGISSNPPPPPQGGLFAGVGGNPPPPPPQGGLFAGTSSNPPPQGGLFAGISKNVQQPQTQAPSIKPTPPVPSKTSSSKPPAPELPLKVLYAEDNLVNQKVLSRVLKRVGISNVTIVDNGKKAVDICQTQQFDCIFMDIQMPVMGGMEATKLIMDHDPEAKVIVVTAHALDEFKAQAVAVGAISFISKPFRLEDIKNILIELFQIEV